MRLIVSILFLLLGAEICNSQPISNRIIDWGEKSYQTELGAKSFLWFNNAVYPDHETMAPVYFELLPIDENINFENIIIEINDEKWCELNEPETILIRYPEKIVNQKFYYSIARQGGIPFAQLSVPAIRRGANDKFEKLTAFSVTIKETQQKSIATPVKSILTTKTPSVLQSGNWVKINVDKSGVYKITYAELQANGLSNLANISVWGNGGKALPYMNNKPSPDDLISIPIYIEKGSDGIFNQNDYILFYAEGPNTLRYDETEGIWTTEQHPYSSKAHYFLTTDKSQNIMSTGDTPSEPATRTTTAYDAIVTFEKNDTNLVKSGREWFGEMFDITTTQTYNTNLANPEMGSTLKVWLRACARSTAESSYLLKANSTNLGYLTLGAITVGDELADLVSVDSKVFSTSIPSGNLTLGLTYNKANSASIGWLDFITVNARQTLTYSSAQLLFHDNQSVATGAITQFTLQNANQSVQIWDVTDVNKTKRIATQPNAGSLIFKQKTDTIKHFIAFEPSNAYTVSFVGSVGNQNLHGLAQPNMVIVAHPLFMAQAQELAAIHQANDGLSVAVITPEQAYNEFSSGNPDVGAIRNLMRMLYQRATNDNERPKYLLLFGDGSYNNISSKSGNTNLILTYQSDYSINKAESFVSDDFFGLLDENEGGADGLLDVGIGRIPAKSTDEANAVINKIKQYLSTENLGDWQNQLCFIGDDEDSNTHMQDANNLSNYIRDNHPEYNIKKIFFDAYNQETSSTGASYPEATNAINTTVNNGALLINYTGHGNERWLAHEKVVMLNDVLSWKNMKALPLFVTATCEFSRFDDYNLTSTGEWILLSPNGGGIALLSTTRLVYSSPNYVLNYNFIKTLFTLNPADNSYYRLGDLVKISKNLSGSGYNKRNFSLLGDPALKLRNPNLKMELLTVNGKTMGEPLDTLKALSEVTITGQVTNFSGDLMDNFDGITTVTVFDKNKSITTLANDGGTPLTFESRENVLYKGNATVQNGIFEVSFIIPKDINYQYGTGRISLFAADNTQTALGYNEALIVGGVSNTSWNDNSGPVIELYLNDENFKSGGICDPNPKLFIKLYDESGINTTGIGIGHDLTATIAGNNADAQSYNLNNYYKSDIDSYQSGSIEYQLTALSEGSKTLTVKAWDIYNNSSEAEISFIVTSGNHLILKNFFSYPNPFADKTSMYFEHNQPESALNIEVQIYNLAGMLVHVQRYNMPPSGNYRIGPLDWTGTNSNGSMLSRGMYICKLIVRSSTGGSAHLQQKLIIAR